MLPAALLLATRRKLQAVGCRFLQLAPAGWGLLLAAAVGRFPLLRHRVVTVSIPLQESAVQVLNVDRVGQLGCTADETLEGVVPFNPRVLLPRHVTEKVVLWIPSPMHIVATLSSFSAEFPV